METLVLDETPAAERPACAPAAPVVKVRDAVLAFGGEEVLGGVTFDLRPGEIVLLHGGNGSGKTVLLNVLCGYLALDAGSVRMDLRGKWINPARVTPDRLARLGVGRLWQDVRLFPTMTVLDNVLAATRASFDGWSWLGHLVRPRFVRDEHEERALEHLRLVGMCDRVRSSCDMLSFGEMKRVALARLLQMEAGLLLLDEPFAGLDATATAALAQDLQRLRNNGDKTILVVEHRREVRRFVDRVWTMRNGRVRDGGAGRV